MGRGRDEQTKAVLSSSEMAGFVFIPASQSLLHKPRGLMSRTLPLLTEHNYWRPDAILMLQQLCWTTKDD